MCAILNKGIQLHALYCFMQEREIHMQELSTINRKTLQTVGFEKKLAVQQSLPIFFSPTVARLTRTTPYSCLNNKATNTKRGTVNSQGLQQN